MELVNIFGYFLHETSTFNFFCSQQFPSLFNISVAYYFIPTLFLSPYCHGHYPNYLFVCVFLASRNLFAHKFPNFFICSRFFWVQYPSSIRIFFSCSFIKGLLVINSVFVKKSLYLSLTLRVCSKLIDVHFPHHFEHTILLSSGLCCCFWKCAEIQLSFLSR